MSNIKAIKRFRSDVKDYRDLLRQSTGSLLDIEKNHEELSIRKSSLIKQHAVLEDVIAQYSKKPHYFDPVWRVSLDVYELGLSTDILQRRGPALNAMLDDLDYIQAKLEANPRTKIKKQTESIKNKQKNKSKEKLDNEYNINEGTG